MAAPATGQFTNGFGDIQRPAVGTIFSHRVPCVGNGDNAGNKGDIPVFQAPGISAPVEPFLMGEDDFTDIPE